MASGTTDDVVFVCLPRDLWNRIVPFAEVMKVEVEGVIVRALLDHLSTFQRQMTEEQSAIFLRKQSEMERKIGEE